jgi:uncharacterized SAM-binding protein YcdF (DUF218 family)
LGIPGLALTAFGLSFACFVLRIESTETMPARHAEGAVALTGGAERISDAVDLLLKGAAARLLITGVNPLTTRREIVLRTPKSRALFSCCIELGYTASNTVGNAAETQAWVRAHNIRSLIVVTSNYHMPRALAEIGSALPDVDLMAYPVVAERSRLRPWWTDEQGLRVVLWEYCKYMAAVVRLRLAPPRPIPAEEAAAVRVGRT